MKLNVVLLCLSVYAGLAAPVSAEDTIETSNGAVLIGDITRFDNTDITLLTDYAGEITVRRDAVTGFSSTEPRIVRLRGGRTLTGIITAGASGILEIAGADTTLRTNLDEIVESWRPGQKDPEQVRLEQQRDSLRRSWSFKAGVDIAGKSGNSKELGTDVNVVAQLAGVDDALKLYGSLERAEKDGDETSDETILGAEYTSFFSELWGWFVRGEVERDDFENLDLRTSIGAGLSYRLLNRPQHVLRIRGGAGYRFEDFNDGTSESSPTLDFGLEHNWQFTSWARLSSVVTYLPAVSEFADFLLVQDSGIEMPLGVFDQWVLRLGVRNEFKNRPAEGRKKLDSSYYSRIELNWE